MTREEYLSALKSNITSLTDEEKSEALQYYSDYFEEAGDDEKVMKELGTPEELASTIMEKFSNALSISKTDKKDDGDGKSDNEVFSDKGFWTFPKEDISSLEIEVGACHAVLIPGDNWIVETRGIRTENFSCFVKNKKLTISNTRKMNFLDYFNHDRKSRLVPRILITIPTGTDLEEVKIKLGAGLLKTHELSLKSQKTVLSVGAGNMEITGLNSSKASLNCGMGNINLNGSLSGKINVDCGMGNISLNLKGDEDNFSYDCKVGIGEFRLNETKYAGVHSINPTEMKANHLSVNVGMGSVNCKINK